MNQNKKIGAVLILLGLLLILFASSTNSAISPAPKVDGYCSNGANTAISISCNLVVPSGDAVIVVVPSAWGSGSTTISGGGLSYSRQVISGPISSSYQVEIFSASFPSGGSLSVMASTTSSGSSAAIFVLAVSGIGPSAIATATGGCAIPCGVLNPSTSSSVSASGGIAIAGVYGTCGIGTCSPGPGFVQIISPITGPNVEDSTVVGTTNFPETSVFGQGSVWVEAGAVFAAPSPLTNSFWMNPLFLLGLLSIVSGAYIIAKKR